MNFATWSPIEILTLQASAMVGSTTIFLLLTSGIPYLVYRQNLHPLTQPRKEATLTYLNLLIYILPFLAVTAVELLSGYTVRYDSVAERGWPYFFASIGIFIFVLDAHFFFTHRTLHKMRSRAHAVHHQFLRTTAWGGFSFHAAESILLTLPYIPLLLLVPWHPVAVLATQVFAMTYNAFLHLGHEPLTEPWRRRWSKIFMTASHHGLHHLSPKYNYGLYFTHWDRWFGSERADRLP